MFAFFFALITENVVGGKKEEEMENEIFSCGLCDEVEPHGHSEAEWEREQTIEWEGKMSPEEWFRSLRR